MKYVAPEFATIAIETKDIILVSEGGGSDAVETPEEEL